MDDVVLLSRIQFAFTVMFHYLFPPLSIGLGLLLVIFEGIYLKTKDRFWLNLTKFWVLLFAATFAMGVASGIVLEFEFGTNWAIYSRFVGDVFGSALAAEGIFAFFLESGFLAVLLFGWNRVGPKMHFFSTLMVFLGSVFSSVWIVIANCYMQTPAGDKIVPVIIEGKTWIVDGEIMRRAEIHDFWALVFNPSTIDRLTHVWAGAFILGGCFVLSVSAYYLIRGRHERFAKSSFKIALVVAFLGTLMAGFTGDMSARGVAKNQPQKLAAMEGHYKTSLDEPTGLALFGIPNDKEEKLDMAIEIPGLLSMMVHHDLETPIVGQDAFPKNDRPNTFLVFWSFRVMVGIGMTLMALTALGLLLLYKGIVFKIKLLLWVFVLAVVPAMLGNQFGWLVAEFGRQPFMVYPKYEMVLDARKSDTAFKDYARAGIEDGVFKRYWVNPDTGQIEDGLRVSNGVSRAIKAEMVLGSIIMFLIIYGLLFFVWLYVLHMKITKGPADVDGNEPYEDIEAQKAKGFFASTEGWTEGSMTAAHSGNTEEAKD